MPTCSKQLPRRMLGAYVLAEVAAYAHHTYAKRRARHAPPPTRTPADPEYRKHFLSWARCDAREAGSDRLACARFIRHAFYGAPPEAISMEALEKWLDQHLGEVNSDTLRSLEDALGPYAPSDGTEGFSGATCDVPTFVFGEGPVKAVYKPLPLKLAMEVQYFYAVRRLTTAGYVEHRDERLPELRIWERRPTGNSKGSTLPPLVVLHGYGRGIASPLFSNLVPALGDRAVIIIDCPWLLVTRVPKSGDVTHVPTVREISEAVSRFLSQRAAKLASTEYLEVDVLAHSFGTAVASALAQGLQHQSEVKVRRAILMDPMCFLPGITKQAQLLRRSAGDVAAELVAEASPGTLPPSMWEVMKALVWHQPQPCAETPSDEVQAASERRQWVIFQTYLFYYFIFRDLVYSWVNQRALQGPEYLDRGVLRQMNKGGRLLTVLAETDMMIPATLLREELAAEAPAPQPGGVLWLPTVGHGACQHKPEVIERICSFLSACE